MTTAAFTVNPLNDSFLELLPIVRRHAQRAFRCFDHDRRQEFIQEVVAYAFVAFVRLLERGRGHLAFPVALARFGIRRVHSGRRVGTPTNRRDVLFDAAQRFRHCTLHRLDKCHDIRWQAALIDRCHAPIPDQVWILIDVPAWLSSLSARNRQIAEALASGHTTTDVAHHFRLSLSRISQLRRELELSWLTFQGEPSLRR